MIDVREEATAALGPAALFGELFVEVQARRLFVDGKTFPDMEPRRSPAEIMAAWRALPLTGDDDIRRFVSEHFAPPVTPEIAAAGSDKGMGDHIASLWERLVVMPQTCGPYSSALTLPCAYVIPGGRFREIYYWDSYFTMLGLAIDGRGALVEQMIDNFVSLVERYGHVPNGTRSYYLSRSQPPFLALMMGLSQAASPEKRHRRLAALRREYDYWMRGAGTVQPGAAYRHVVRIGGDLLNRFWDALDTPRPEAFAEDVALAARSERPAAEVYRDVRAAAESGWDFSSRWLRAPPDMTSIETTSLVPVDLNCLLYLSERRIAAECRALNDARASDRFAALAEERAAVVQRYCWIADEGRFADWHWIEGRPVGRATAATLYPLFAGIATSEQAAAVARLVERSLLAPGGLRTTTVETGQQWDMPNGWAPLQWIAFAGLERYGHGALADLIAERWLATVHASYEATGALYEKYDIETGRPAGGGEYPNQEGFGWTNGVVKALLAESSKRK